MDKAAIKEARQILRRVQDHLYQSHSNLGVQQESVGLVDVFHHPESTLASLNYVAPRRKTAWISGDMVQQGLDHLQGLQRTPRIQYIEGLFPPLFARTLRDLNLVPEWELPLMIYVKDGFNGHPAPSVTLDQLPLDVNIEIVNDQRGIELWWYVWRNAYYDVLTLGVEPVVVGRDMAALEMGRQMDILLYRAGFPVGVVRMSIHEQTAHVVALALMKEARTPELLRTLYIAAACTALERGCTMVYAPGMTETDRRICREVGFLDIGSMVCFRAQSETNDTLEEKHGYIMGQPILALR
ncbi:MAG: hypothetical protein K8L99_28690 [Anaerolineae bacterium]|nr:hypothetical protein [Anaerolineae bacterium]